MKQKKSSKIFKTFFQKSSTNTTSSECPENSTNSKVLEDAGLSSTEKEFVTASNDAEKISENILTRYSENSNSRKSAISKELEDRSDKEIDIDDVEVNKNLMSKDAENIKNPISTAIEERDTVFLSLAKNRERQL